MSRLFFLMALLLGLISFGASTISAQPNSKGRFKKTNAIFRIRVDDSIDTDTLIGFFNDRIIHVFTARYSWQQSVLTKDKDGIYNLIIDSIDSPGYFSLSRKVPSKGNASASMKSLLWNFLVEPGDNININIRKDSQYVKTINPGLGTLINEKYYAAIYGNPELSIFFSGPGSDKYECRYLADRMTSSSLREDTSKFVVGRRQMISLRISLNLLGKYRKILSRQAYEIMKADFTGYFEEEWYQAFRTVFTTARDKSDKKSLKWLTNDLRLERSRRLSLPAPNVFDISANYASMVIGREKTENLVKWGSTRNNLYSSLNKYPPNLFDRIITTYLTSEYKSVDGLDEMLVDALSLVKTGYYHDLLQELQNTVTSGKPAFNFSLPDSSGKLVSLDDMKGRVVLIDFWYKNCSNCVDYYVYTLSQVEELFKNNKDVVFVSINVDSDKATWITALYGNKYTSLDAVNLNTGSLGTNHPVINHYKVLGYPRPLLIDKEGKIFSASSKLLRQKQTLVDLIHEALDKKPVAINENRERYEK